MTRVESPLACTAIYFKCWDMKVDHQNCPFFFSFFWDYLFWERERVSTRTPAGKGQREMERERTPSRVYAVSTEPSAGLELTNHEIMTWVKVKSQMLNWLSPPGAPEVVIKHNLDGEHPDYSGFCRLPLNFQIVNVKLGFQTCGTNPTLFSVMRQGYEPSSIYHWLLVMIWTKKILQFYVRALWNTLHLSYCLLFLALYLRAESISLYRIPEVVISGQVKPSFSLGMRKLKHKEIRGVVPGSVNGFTLRLLNAFLFKKLNNCYNASGFFIVSALRLRQLKLCQISYYKVSGETEAPGSGLPRIRWIIAILFGSRTESHNSEVWSDLTLLVAT